MGVTGEAKAGTRRATSCQLRQSSFGREGHGCIGVWPVLRLTSRTPRSRRAVQCTLAVVTVPPPTLCKCARTLARQKASSNGWICERRFAVPSAISPKSSEGRNAHAVPELQQLVVVATSPPSSSE